MPGKARQAARAAAALGLAFVAGLGHAALPAAVDGAPLPSLAPLLERATPAVVNVYTETRVQVRSPFANDPFFRHFFNLPDMPRERISRSLGSGVIVDAAAGYVITNHHVIAKADDIAVTLIDGRNFKAERIGSDPDTDLALIQIPAEDLAALPLGDSDRLRVGDFVVAIGNPFGLGQTVTSGIVSALGRTALSRLPFQDFIQTDAPINPGNSGGALIDLNGELVGVNSAIFTPSGGNVGIGFAIPANMTRRVMRQLIDFGEVRRGTLAIETQDLTSELASAFGLEASRGAVVTRVWPATPAAESGLKPGDVVIAAAGHPVRNTQELRNFEAMADIGTPLALTVLRDGREQTLNIELVSADTLRVAGASLTPELAGAEFTQKSGGAERGKVVIADVARGSAAARQGVLPGDEVLAVNRQSITDLNDLTRAFSAVKARQITPVLQIRRGDNRYLVPLEPNGARR